MGVKLCSKTLQQVDTDSIMLSTQRHHASQCRDLREEGLPMARQKDVPEQGKSTQPEFEIRRGEAGDPSLSSGCCVTILAPSHSWDQQAAARKFVSPGMKAYASIL